MADGHKHSEELLPLRSSAERPGASREDRLLARGMAALYPPRGPAGAEAGIEDAWAGIEGAALASARRRRRRYLLRELLLMGGPRSRPLLWLGAAAGAILLVVVVRGRWPAAPASAGMLVTAARAALATSADAPRREARLLDGAELSLTDGAAAIDQADQAQTRIALRKGAVHVEVPHLSHRGRLVVSTTDAEVIVHGTRFDVRKVDPDTTQVSVAEGLVEVRPQGGQRGPAFLRPGESLTVHSAAYYLGQISRRVDGLIAAAGCDDPDGSLDTYLRIAPARTDVSAALYLKGYCAAQRGALEEAIGYFERVASTGTESIRADNAMARAAQLLASRGPAQGAAAWKRYLGRFPAGLHHLSARRFLSGYDPAAGP